MTDRVERLPRCCPHHEDWPTLASHLRRDFPSIPSEQILRGVVEAQNLLVTFAIDPSDGLELGELMVRYRLMLATGQIADAARTDPQTHRVANPKEESDPWAMTPSTS